MPQSVEEIIRQSSHSTSVQVRAFSFKQIISLPEKIKVLNEMQSSGLTDFGQPCVQLKQPAEFVYPPVDVWERSTNERWYRDFIKTLK